MKVWLEKFSKIINKLFPTPPKKELYLALDKLDPNKFYSENVRSILNISAEEAEQICQDAVKEGIFIKGQEIVCPDGSIARSIEEGQPFPDVVECWEYIDNDYEPNEYRVTDLKRNPYYRFTGVR